MLGVTFWRGRAGFWRATRLVTTRARSREYGTTVPAANPEGARNKA